MGMASKNQIKTTPCTTHSGTPRGLSSVHCSMTGHKSLAMLKRYTHIEAEKSAQKLG